MIHLTTMCNIPGMLRGIPGCIINVLAGLDGREFRSEAWFPWAEEPARTPQVKLGVPDPFFRLEAKLGLSGRFSNPLTERRFLASTGPSSVAWMFPQASARVWAELRRRGSPIILERVNSEPTSARAILTEAAQRLGLPDRTEEISDFIVELDQEEVEKADLIFVCSPFVERSYLEAGVSKERLFRCSYGWDPAQLAFPQRRYDGRGAPLFLFAGTGCLRKGLPNLLEQWAAANPPARLRVLGDIEPWLLERYRDKFNRPDIETFPYSPRIQKHFEEADVFVLPSHEEGSPLVTYIAMAAGLPCLTSFAGGGGLINNGCEGLVVDPWNDAAFQQAIYSLATDSGLREKLGRAAEKAAAKYVWPEVARRRAEGFRTAASLAQRS